MHTAWIATARFGAFLYIGQQILDGKVPYLDVWDHKGPVLYFINAFGLFIGAGSAWGVWSLEVASLLITVTLLSHVYSKVFGVASAVGALIIVVSLLGTILGMRVSYVENIARLSPFLTQRAVLVALERTQKSIPIDEFTFAENNIVVLGNEKSGVDQEILQNAQATVHIPMDEALVGSLNVNAAAAVALSKLYQRIKK